MDDAAVDFLLAQQQSDHTKTALQHHNYMQTQWYGPAEAPCYDTIRTTLKRNKVTHKVLTQIPLQLDPYEEALFFDKVSVQACFELSSSFQMFLL